jgi:hypothetical protein
MPRDLITIHKGKVTVQGEGYKGTACHQPLQEITDVINGTVVSTTTTAEGLLPDETEAVSDITELFQ